MLVDYLTSSEIDFINKSLFENKGMGNLEYENFKSKHPYIVMDDNDILILSSKKYYGLHDLNLNSFIIEKFGKPEYEIDFFYELTYNVNDYTTPHRDAHFILQTTLVLLSDTFEGGRLIIDGKDTKFTKVGQYINFNGYNQVHEVTQVESGQRRVLVIMFNKKKELF